MEIKTLLLTLFACSVNVLSAQKPYWNEQTKLTPWRFPLVGDTARITYEDLTGDGNPDIIRGFICDSIPFMWIDDNGDMRHGDLEGDMVDDCLLIDLNCDGIFAGPEDLSVDWVDNDDDGIADMQFVIFNGKEGVRYGADYESDFICVIDIEKDGIQSFIDWNRLKPLCWEHSGHSNFFQDYHGNTLLLKMHASSFRVADLRYNCENPFIFDDPDSDGLTEMTIRMMDVPHIRPRPGEKHDLRFDDIDEGYDMLFSKRITWVAFSWDMDNDNGQGNEFDLDMTIHFAGKGFDYSGHVNKFAKIRGLQEANKYLYDSRWREMDELVYPGPGSVAGLTFDKGEWDYCWFVFDEDDDCNRWERVELYYPLDLFTVGARKGGLDGHQQADAIGDRGEFDNDNSGKGKLYLSPIDGRIHLYGAEWGAWRIDQNASCFQGYGGLYPPMKKVMRLAEDPDSWATVKYTDTDNNGFFDTVEYDLDGDTVFEERVSLIELGMNDTAPLYDPSVMEYPDMNNLFEESAETIWSRAMQVIETAEKHFLNTSWYTFWKQPRTLFEKYSYGYWLSFYLYRDLKHSANFRGNADFAVALDKCYYSGNWGQLLK